MATKAPTQNFITGNVIEMEAEAAIVVKRLVKLGTAAGQVIHTAAITDVVVGVSLNDAAAGGRVKIQVSGVAEVECASAITYLDQVMPVGTGAGKAATAAGATAKSCGQAGGITTANAGETQMLWLHSLNVNGPANT